MSTVSHVNDRDDRRFDLRPSCDVHGSDMVGVVREPTLDADKLCLALAVALVAVATVQTGAGRVARIDDVDPYARETSLVRDERPELSEGPAHVTRTLRPPNRYPVADPRKVFKGDAAFGVLSLADESLRDHMVRIGSEPGLTTGQALEMTLCALGPTTLKRATERGVLDTAGSMGSKASERRERRGDGDGAP